MGFRAEKNMSTTPVPNTFGGWKIAYVGNNAAAPICVCGYSRALHRQIVQTPRSNGDQTAIIYLECTIEASGCFGYSADMIAGSLGMFG